MNSSEQPEQQEMKHNNEYLGPMKAGEFLD